MNMEALKVLAPYFTSILGGAIAICIAVYNNNSRAKEIQKSLVSVNHGLQELKADYDNKLASVGGKIETVDQDLRELKRNHFVHLGEYLKKLNAFLHRGKLMDEVEQADMDSLANGVAGRN